MSTVREGVVLCFGTEINTVFICKAAKVNLVVHVVIPEFIN